MKRSPLFWLGSAAALAIVALSVVVRGSSPADPAADVATQRADVERFYGLVSAGRWAEVYEATTEPPAKSAGAFADLMRQQATTRGTITGVRVEKMRLLRSRTVPLLEVHDAVTSSKNGRIITSRNVSYFARRDDRWLFAFSAPQRRR